MTTDYTSDVAAYGDQLLAPASPGSKLTSLREARRKAEDSLFIDLEVPRYDPPVFVRFGPVAASTINAVSERTRLTVAKDPDAGLKGNIAILVESCRGVYVRDSAGLPVAPDTFARELPKFDAVLGEALGVTSDRAADVVRALYLTDGDIVLTAVKVTEWSGFAAGQISEAVQGE